MDFFETLNCTLKTSNPAEVTNKSSYNKVARQRIMNNSVYNAKDIRKHVDTALYKKVDKHFTHALQKTAVEEISGVAADTVL